mmetsp:Transcript_63541/g.101124  ORF Transcript_63541/g.101124 Transcript_63541/m.101124 type:complete len:177 (-) Transcript_63541:3000-3530(-)
MAASFDIEQIQKILNETEKGLQKIPQLKKVKEATSIKIVYLLMGLLVVSLILIYVFSGLRALSTLVGVVYPGWCSLKAIKSKEKDDDTLWLSYWVIYGIFSAFESITDLFLFWIPFYELLKICFYFYLFSPQLKGALTLYYVLLEPLVDKAAKVEANAVNAANSVRETFASAQKKK